MSSTAVLLPEHAIPATRVVDARRPLVIGHRGSSGVAPEHTLASYDLALRDGVDYLELDLQMTGDGVLVAMHDPTVDRTARDGDRPATGRVRDKTLEELKSYDVGCWFNEAYPELSQERFVGENVPTLAQVLLRYGTAVSYYIEAKHPDLYPGMEEELLRTIDMCGLSAAAHERGVLVQSFSEKSLRTLHEFDPHMPLIKLCRPSDSPTNREQMGDIAAFAVGLGPCRTDASVDLIRDAHEVGLAVDVYTVNSSRQMKRLIDRGVDGIFTDFPRRLNRVLANTARGWQGAGHPTRRAG